MSKFETGNYYNALNSDDDDFIEDDEKIAAKVVVGVDNVKNRREVARKTKRAAAEQILTACVSRRGLLTMAGDFSPCEMDDFVIIADYLLHTDSSTVKGAEWWNGVERHLLSLVELQSGSGGLGQIAKCLVVDHEKFLVQEIATSSQLGKKTRNLTKYLQHRLEIPDADSLNYNRLRFVLLASFYLREAKFAVAKQVETKLRSTISAILKNCDSSLAENQTVDECKCNLATGSLQSIVEIIRGRAHLTQLIVDFVRQHFWHKSDITISTIDTISTISAGYFCDSVTFNGGEVKDKSIRFNVEANALAIEHGLATPEQQEQIFDYYHHFTFSDHYIARDRLKMLLQMSRAGPKWREFAQQRFDKWCTALSGADAGGTSFESGAMAALFCVLDDQLRENDKQIILRF